jgi:AcrR family transcriptional regulator
MATPTIIEHLLTHLERLMARPLSEEKRNAILKAAADVVASLGVSAPTAKIAKGAGVAEGTLFTYFDTKDALLNQLYLELKAELETAMTAGYPSKGALRDRWRHSWDRYLDWGSAQPAKRKAMRQLMVSDRITQESREIGGRGFREIEAMMEESRAAGVLRDQAPAFVAAIMESLAETTLEFIAREPERREHYKGAGFDAFWNAVCAP